MISKWDTRLEAGRSGNASPRPVGQSPQELNILVRAKSAHAKGGANNCRAARQPVPANRRNHGHVCMDAPTEWQCRRHAPRDVSPPRPALTGVNSGAGGRLQGGRTCAAISACLTKRRCERHRIKRQRAPSRIACATRRQPRSRGTNRRTCLRVRF